MKGRASRRGAPYAYLVVLLESNPVHFPFDSTDFLHIA